LAGHQFLRGYSGIDYGAYDAYGVGVHAIAAMQACIFAIHVQADGWNVCIVSSYCVKLFALYLFLHFIALYLSVRQQLFACKVLGLFRNGGVSSCISIASAKTHRGGEDERSADGSGFARYWLIRCAAKDSSCFLTTIAALFTRIVMFMCDAASW
jgi:hypothetical protein